MNELITTGEHYLALQPDSEIREAMEANLSTGETITESDLVRVPIPTGGQVIWTIDGIRGQEQAETLTGILVYVCVRGVLWPSDDPGENERPLLMTDDLITAHLACDAEDIPADMADALEAHKTEDGYDWMSLPWNQWGSGKGGEGKRCREQRVFFLLRPGDAWPLVVTVQPGSLKEIKSFIRTLPLPHWRCIVSLMLSKEKNKAGQPFSKVHARLEDTLSREQGDIVKALYTEPLRSMRR